MNPATGTARCRRCRGSAWIWCHGTDRAGVIRIAEITCPACRGRGVGA